MAHLHPNPMEADFSLLHHIPVYFIVTRRIICL